MRPYSLAGLKRVKVVSKLLSANIFWRKVQTLTVCGQKTLHLLYANFFGNCECVTDYINQEIPALRGSNTTLGEEACLGTIVCRIASRVKFPPQAKGIDRQTVGLEAAMAGLTNNPARADAIDHGECKWDYITRPSG